jgi:hypothetical protein
MFFILAATWGEPGTVAQKLLVTAVGLGIVLGTALAPLANAKFGGGLQLLVGALLGIANFTFFHNPAPTQLFLLLTMVLPPILSGVLFVSSARPYGQPN